MAPPGADIMPDTTTSTHTSSEEELASSVSRIAVQDEASQTEPPNPEKKTTLSQQMRIYTRPQLLFLHNSPLVNPPPDMPELKDWFGYVAPTSISPDWLNCDFLVTMIRIPQRKSQSLSHLALREREGFHKSLVECQRLLMLYLIK